MPCKREPSKRAIDVKNSKAKTNRTVLKSKATTVALANSIEIENEDLKKPNETEAEVENNGSMDIVIHIEIERVEMSTEEATEENTIYCSPTTPITRKSLLKTTAPVTRSLSALHSPCLRHAGHTYFEYDPDVLAYFRERELSNRPKPNYLQQQPQIDRAARAFLVNWLVTIASEHELDTEILYRAVAYIDRFLSKVMIQRSKLQVVGVACLHISVKLEFSRPPPIAKLAANGDVHLDVKQIIQMEQIILKALSFDLRLPTAFTFVSDFAMATKVPNLLKYLTMYICELTLLEAEPYLQFLPSQIAAAAYALARYILGYDIWSELLTDVTNCRLENLKQIFLSLCKTHACASKIPPKAIQMKYLQKDYNEVASMSAVYVSDALFDYLCEYYYLLVV